MKKSKVLATILTVTMAFSVTACSSKSEKEEETTVAVTTEATTAASTEAATEAATEAKAADTQTAPAAGTTDSSIIGKWGFTVGEGADQYTIYYTFNEDGSGNITYSDPTLIEQSFTYTADGAHLNMKNSDTHTEGSKYSIDGDTLTLDDGIQVSTYTRA